MIHEIWREYPEIEKALKETKQTMRKGISIRIPEIEVKIQEYIDAPGKYLRAGLSLMFFYMENGSMNKKIITYAAAIELLHLATLIHDDVIDTADSRRGIEAMHIAQSNKIAVYAGDYLFSYSGRLASDLIDEVQFQNRNKWILENIMSGELRQLANTFNKEMTMIDYIRQIRGKTAMLFGLSVSGGYYLANNDIRKAQNVRLLGTYLGIAFQLQDDLIDFLVPAGTSGKPIMQDVPNGIYTAPLLLAMEKSDSVRRYVNESVEWDEASLDKLSLMIKETGAFHNTEVLINRYIEKALFYLDKISDSEYKAQIEKIILLISNRQY
ncbi:polyprenyl synthetase family protein [Aerococcaceae bacterium INB8]|uniref:Polyprenyl synthetase family protein n=1 Tax=Ruoffia halotolerans TaxID=2748684 RepID=A0A839A822_9LACT|nr:polyprenyl synthetase family protein [Ruoffia halotolerans]MBA5730217.1 polyprenyl synthetase family protein [Ruoffia halotolerans]